MKAQFVYENLDFERGRDPRGVLGKYVPGKLVKYDEDHYSDDSNDYPEYYIQFGDQLVDIAYHSVSDYGPKWNWVKSNMLYPEEIGRREKPHIKELGGWELAEVEDKFMNSQEGQDILKVLKKDHNVLLPKHLYESLEFEKGKDPKEALRIGTVKVNGDRGYGEYNVRLLDRYYGSDLLQDEEIWRARDIDSGNIVYVVKHSDFKTRTKGVWGEIDPFISE